MKINTFLEKNKRVFFLLTLAIFIFLFIVFEFLTIKERTFNNLNSTIVANRFLIIAIISTICVFLSYFWIVKKEADISKVYLFSIISLGLAYMVIFLPHIVPDEPVHYFSAYRLSNYLTFNFEQANTKDLLIRQSDIDLFNKTATVTQNADYFYTIANKLCLFSKENSLVKYGVEFVTNAPFGYIFSSVGIAIGRVLRLSPLLVFGIGRFFNVLSYAVMTWWAIKRIPYGKIAIFTICVLPMSLHLAASFSYDSQILAFALMFVAQVLYMKEKSEPITYKDIILCAILGIILAPNKLVYLPFILLVYIIPKEKFAFSAKKVFWIKTAIFAVAFIFMLLLQLKSLLETTKTSDLAWEESGTRSVSWILANPAETIRIYLNTIFTKLDFYLSTMIGSTLGWFQLKVPIYCYIPFAGFLLYSFMTREGEVSTISFSNKLWTFLIAIVTFLLLLTSMFLAWTPLSYDYIEGIQGRYIIPLLILVYLVVKNKSIVVNPNADKYAMFLLLYWNLYVGIQYFVTSFV